MRPCSFTSRLPPIEVTASAARSTCERLRGHRLRNAGDSSGYLPAAARRKVRGSLSPRKAVAMHVTIQ
ncbi:hypothetical protein BC628DRAFT_1369017 [Trametes gibbosa]|nr:hypothetical protein BC628DRAFT_1369017 [Trametes gibbosa]